MKTITIKYTVESNEKYLLLVKKAYQQFAEFGLDIYTNQAEHVIIISYPADKFDEAVENLELDIELPGNYTAEEQKAPIAVVNESVLLELQNKAGKVDEAINDKDEFKKFWLSANERAENAKEANCRIKKQVQAIALLMNSIFPEED